jgi:sacsin
MEYGEDFGQKVDLCARLREILLNYPEGTAIISELLQNADDAGATEFSLCLDMRQHSTNHLFSPEMASLQGASLLAYNNATFTASDFTAIQRIGDSLKREESSGVKTGRFGIGFNSTYHVSTSTDVGQQCCYAILLALQFTPFVLRS